MSLFFLLAAMALPAAAQQINLDLPELNELRDKAAEEVTVTLDSRMLRMAAKFLSDTDSDQRNARDIVRNLEGIYVRSYEFDHEGEYDQAIADRIRAQLGAKWNKIVDVRSRTRENSEIYMFMHGDAIAGMVVISSEPKELTIVNIVGPIDLDRLSQLDGQFGIPRMTKKESKP